MKWTLPNGKSVYKNDFKFLIDWNSKKRSSKGEKAVKQFLFDNCPNHVIYEEYVLPFRRLRVDFLDTTKKIAIEHQGKQHNNYVEHFHKNRTGYYRSIQRDTLKLEMLELNGYTLVETYDDDLPLTKKFFLDKYNIKI